MPPALRIRPYKDFLTPLLHRRFTRAAATLLLLVYVEALFIGSWNGCRCWTLPQSLWLLIVCSVLDLDTIWSSWHTDGTSFHLCILNLRLTSRSASCRTENDELACYNFSAIRLSLSNHTNSWLVSFFSMAVYRNLHLLGAEDSKYRMAHRCQFQEQRAP